MSSRLSSGNFSPPDVDFSSSCWFEVPGLTFRVFLFSGSEGPERLVSGINQFFPSCLGDLQSLDSVPDKYFVRRLFCEPFFVNIY